MPLRQSHPSKASCDKQLSCRCHTLPHSLLTCCPLCCHSCCVPRHAASEAASRPQSEGPSRSQSIVAPSGMSATLKGLLGGASSKLLGSIMGRGSGSGKSEASAEEQEELWFTSLDDFKPICHMLHRGRYMTAYFACANKTGQHFLLKKFDKRASAASRRWEGCHRDSGQQRQRLPAGAAWALHCSGVCSVPKSVTAKKHLPDPRHDPICLPSQLTQLTSCNTPAVLVVCCRQDASC